VLGRLIGRAALDQGHEHDHPPGVEYAQQDRRPQHRPLGIADHHRQHRPHRTGHDAGHPTVHDTHQPGRQAKVGADKDPKHNAEEIPPEHAVSSERGGIAEREPAHHAHRHAGHHAQHFGVHGQEPAQV
jgi:hypothetical protein